MIKILRRKKFKLNTRNVVFYYDYEDSRLIIARNREKVKEHVGEYMRFFEKIKSNRRFVYEKENGEEIIATVFELAKELNYSGDIIEIYIYEAD